MFIETFYRDSWVEVRLDAIRNNIEKMKERLPEDTGVYAVVKANAYGHGDIQVAKAALDAGVEGFAVSLLDEALKLRNEGIVAPIIVMGRVRPEDAHVAATNNVTLTVFQPEWIRQAIPVLSGDMLKVHLKIDTGMGRIGLRTETELLTVISEIKNSSNLNLEGVFTHFATADESDLTYFYEQQERFKSMLKLLEMHWDHPVIIHTGNSAASIRFPKNMHHFVRYGISMYGLYPSKDVKEENSIDLSKAFSLHSKLIHVKCLPKGEYISYGATYQTKGKEWIGTVPLGYADGWVRKLQGIDVLVEGKRMPIVGRVCMDQFMIQLDQEYPIGTKVTLIGSQGKEIITVDEIADHLETINYEIPCLISYRVPRIYYNKGKMVEVDNTLFSR